MSEERPSAAPTGSVVLDIGGDVGALVVYADGSLLGHEIEARPVGHDARPAHASVLPRGSGAERVHAAVITGLVAGAYTLWLDAELPSGEAAVRPGQVAEVSLRAGR